MRKTLVSILSFLLVAGFGASAFAGHAVDAGYEYTPKLVKAGKSNIDLSGSIRIRGDFRDNTTDMNKEVADQKAAYDSRIRLKVDASVSPNTKGVVELEQGYPGDTYTWGTDDNAGGTLSLNGGNGNSKITYGMTLRQAYISHQGTDLLGVLSGFKAGHILTKLGNGLFYNHSKYGDDAIVLFSVPQKGTEVSLMMAKIGEGSTANGTNDDATLYNFGVTTAAAGINLGADLTYIDDQDAGFVAPNETNGLHFWNLGLNAKAEVSGVALYGDFEAQTGKVKRAYVNPITSVITDAKTKGYAWILGAKADVPNSPVSAGLELGYGSGDKIDDVCTNPPACTTFATGHSGNQNEGFLTSTTGSGQLGNRQIAFLYDDKVITAAGATGTGIANTMYINLGADADISPDLNLALDVFYLRAAKSRNIGGALEANGLPKRSRSIGTEVDAKLTYQVDTNLVYYVEAGYMFAGSMYDRDDTTTAAAMAVTGDNLDPDSPYGIRHGLELTF